MRGVVWKYSGCLTCLRLHLKKLIGAKLSTILWCPSLRRTVWRTLLGATVSQHATGQGSNMPKPQRHIVVSTGEPRLVLLGPPLASSCCLRPPPSPRMSPWMKQCRTIVRELWQTRPLGWSWGKTDVTKHLCRGAHWSIPVHDRGQRGLSHDQGEESRCGQRCFGGVDDGSEKKGAWVKKTLTRCGPRCPNAPQMVACAIPCFADLYCSVPKFLWLTTHAALVNGRKMCTVKFCCNLHIASYA